MIKNHLIIFFPLVDWDAPWQRYQHFAKVFSRGNRVIYIEPVLSIKYLLRKPRLLCKKFVGFLRLKRQVDKNLLVLHPPPILPFGNRNHIINCVNQYIIALFIRNFIEEFNGKENLCLWISNAIHYPLIKRLKPKISVYDFTDAFSFRDAKKQGYHDELRRRIIRESSVSFFTSQLYFKEGLKYSDNCHYIPNGVDIQNFKKRHFTVPEEMKNIKRPILGFVGSIDSRIDQGLINEILNKKHDVSLVLIGPIINNLNEIKNDSRLFLFGKKSHSEIPNFIKQFDIALIPYKPEKTEAVYPVKLHEYLILGKPVVSTKINEIIQFSEVVYIANRNEFIENIDLALRDENGKKKKKRIQTALKNTWTDRFEKINRELRKFIKIQ